MSTSGIESTPNLVISITFAIAIYYIVSKSINVIGRTSIILFYISIFLFVFSGLGLIFNLDISNVLPTLEYGVMPIMNGSLNYIAYNVLPLFLITIIPRNELNDSNKKFIRNGIITYSVATLSLFIVVFFILSIYNML